MVWVVPLVLFSAIINILYLTGSLYMMQVYDRVLSSKSISTLVAISLIALLAFAIQGALDAIRGRMLARMAMRFDELSAPEVFKSMEAKAQKRGLTDMANQAPVRDLDQVRAFLSSTAPNAILDFPFMPIFLIGAFILHPWLGWLTILGAGLIVVIAVATDVASRKPASKVSESLGHRHKVAETVSRSGGIISIMGLEPYFRRQFIDRSIAHSEQSLAATDVVASYGAAARLARQVLQSAALGLGGYLALVGEMSAGAIIAASIMTSRALAPIETGVANLKTFAAARVAFANLRKVIGDEEAVAPVMALPPPKASLKIERLFVTAPGLQRPLLNDIALAAEAGDGLGIIGTTGSGKTTLIRAMLGLIPTANGKVKLDGADISQYGADLSCHVGYLPQDVELFEGTIGQNIGRFADFPNDAQIVEAAKAACAHDLIISLPQGYNTRVGQGGLSLSGGQRQRIGLARALYGNPFLLVLDEPNSNLDAEGEAALNAAIVAVRQRGGIAVLVTHRPSALAGVNLVAVLRDGAMVAFGPREKVLQATLQNVNAPATEGQRQTKNEGSAAEATA